MRDKTFKLMLSFTLFMLMSVMAKTQCGTDVPIVIHASSGAVNSIDFSIFDENNVLVLQGDGDDVEETFCLPLGCYTIVVSGLSCSPFSFNGFTGCFPDTWSIEALGISVAGGAQSTAEFCLMYGCTDYLYCNYNPQASFNDGSCDGIPGCTDNTACNFQPYASCDNGTCSTTNSGLPFSFTITDNTGGGLGDVQWDLYGYYANFYGDLSPDPNVWTENVCLLPGCYSFYLDGIPNGHDVTVTFSDLQRGEVYYESSSSYGFVFGGEGGCNDPTACNYNAKAICQTVVCAYPGCTNPQACNYDPLAGCNDGSCDMSSGAQVEIYGSTCHLTITNSSDEVIYDQEIVSGFFSLNTTQYLTCLPFECLTFEVTGLTCGSFFGLTTCEQLRVNVNGNTIYTFYANDFISETQIICITQGCTDPVACNFDSEATTYDGSCGYIVGCTEPNAVNYNANAICDDGSCNGGVYGCTNALSCNYDAAATVDNGSCDLTSTTLTVNVVNNTGGAASAIALVLTDDQGLLYTSITVPVDSSHTEELCLPVACFQYSVFGRGPNDLVTITTHSGSQFNLFGNGTQCLTPGCTNSSFCNYSPLFNVDDGSCCNTNTYTFLSLFDGGSETLDGAVYNIYDSNNALIKSSYSNSIDERFENYCLADGCYSLEIIPDGAGNPITWNIDNGTSFQTGSGGGTFVFTVGGSFGCTDPAACNFSLDAVCDNVSCNYGSPVRLRVTNATSSPAVINYSFKQEFFGPVIASGSVTAQFGQQNFDLCLPEDCLFFTISGMGSGDSYQIGVIQNGNVFVPLQFTQNSGNTNTTNAGVCNQYGCTDNGACNFNG